MINVVFASFCCYSKTSKTQAFMNFTTENFVWAITVRLMGKNICYCTARLQNHEHAQYQIR